MWIPNVNWNQAFRALHKTFKPSSDLRIGYFVFSNSSTISSVYNALHIGSIMVAKCFLSRAHTPSRTYRHLESAWSYFANLLICLRKVIFDANATYRQIKLIAWVNYLSWMLSEFDNVDLNNSLIWISSEILIDQFGRLFHLGSTEGMFMPFANVQLIILLPECFGCILMFVACTFPAILK